MVAMRFQAVQSSRGPSCYGYSFFNENQVFVLIAFLYEDLGPRSKGGKLGLGGCLLCAWLVPEQLRSLVEQCGGDPFLTPQSTKLVEMYGYNHNPSRKVQQLDRVFTPLRGSDE